MLKKERERHAAAEEMKRKRQRKEKVRLQADPQSPVSSPKRSTRRGQFTLRSSVCNSENQRNGKIAAARI